MIVSDKLVSIILPVYNGEIFLKDAIDSIVNQTYRNLEIIIINDGSTDGTKKILEQYVAKDKRIKLVERENKGLIESLNEGIKLSRGYYIARMDADDISVPTRIQEQVNFMERNSDISVCGSWIEVFGEKRKGKLKKYAAHHKELAPLIIFTSPVAHPSTIIRREVFNFYNYNRDFRNAEDYKLWSDMIFNVNFANINRVLLLYRSHNLNTSKVSELFDTKERYEIACNIFQKVLERLDVKNTSEEMEIHFALSLNARSEKYNNEISAVNKYINKLLVQNKKLNVFNNYEFIKLLTYRMLIYIFFQIKNKKLKSLDFVLMKNFWVGTYFSIIKILFY